jgi:hypothetical protein
MPITTYHRSWSIGGPVTRLLATALGAQGSQGVTRGQRLADLLRLAMTDGQNDAAALDYAPLPPSLATRLMTRIDSIAPGGAR